MFALQVVLIVVLVVVLHDNVLFIVFDILLNVPTLLNFSLLLEKLSEVKIPSMVY